MPWHILGDPPWRLASAIPRSPLPADCDVAVIGAGVTGLSAALALGLAGQRVVVIDPVVGGGAATRSGGLIVGDTLVGPAEGFENCAETLRDWVDRHAPECGLTWTGIWELDRDERLPATPIDWRDAGAVRRSAVVAGGTLDPGALISALAVAAANAGVIICDGIRADQHAARGSGVSITTSNGVLSAAAALVCVDAAGRDADADPWPDRKFTVALATAPIAPGVRKAIGWDEGLPFYTNELPLLWGRLLPDDGMIVGRELVVDRGQSDEELGTALAAARDRLIARLHALHPALADVAIARVWAGPIARDAGGVPRIVEDARVPRVWWVGGYGGHGLAQAFRLGQTAAATATRSTTHRR